VMVFEGGCKPHPISKVTQLLELFTVVLVG
jgi:hypothetical protein